LRVHRILGRIYLGGIAVAAPMAIYIAAIHSGIGIRFFVFALAPSWMLAAGTAFAGVRNGNVQLHRQWMVRSYALTSVFVTGRVLLAIPAIDRAGEAVTVPALWILLVGHAGLDRPWLGVARHLRRQPLVKLTCRIRTRKILCQ
jgi:hypothetical protein